MGCLRLEGEAGLSAGKKRYGDKEENCVKAIFNNFYSSLNIINRSHQKQCHGK